MLPSIYSYRKIIIKEIRLTKIFNRMFFYLSYLRAFKKYANACINGSTELLKIGDYANLLTKKANELLSRAALNPGIDFTNLQKDLFQEGCIYIRKYAVALRNVNIKSSIIKNLSLKYTDKPAA